jgi:hypothetical protein
MGSARDQALSGGVEAVRSDPRSSQQGQVSVGIQTFILRLAG